MCFFKVCGYENIRFLKQPPEVLCKKGVLTNFTKFTGKDLCQSLFFNKVAGLSPATLLKKRLWYRCFHVNFAELLRTRFLQNTSGRLFLHFLRLQEYSFDLLDIGCRYL